MAGEFAKRTFQFNEGSSDKFWEVWTDGCDVTTHWGRTGTDGQSKTKTYGSEDEAEKAAQKAIAQKLKKGYTETTEDADLQPVGVAEATVRASNAPTGGVREVPKAAKRQPQEVNEDVDEEKTSAPPSASTEVERLSNDEEAARLDEIESLAERLHEMATDRYAYGMTINRDLLKQLETLAKNGPLSKRACHLLRRARDAVRVDSYFYDDDETKQQMRIDVLVGDDRTRVPIRPGEVWADQVIADLLAMQEEPRVAWLKVIRHCVTATSSKPTSKWRKTAEDLLEGVPDFNQRLAQWLPLIDKPKEDSQPNPRSIYLHSLCISEPNQNVLRGLIWCYSFVPDDALPKVLGTVGVSAYRKIPQIGERATRVGNACVFAIGGVSSSDSVAQLALLKIKVKTATARKLIEKQLDQTAERQGVSRAELEEMAVPTYGMEEVGLREEPLEEFTALLRVENQKTVLQWRNADGKVQKSVPAAVKRDHADEVKELKAAAKDIDKMLATQKQRIESFYMEPREWSVTVWKERYLDHPLVGTIARRLLWRFRNAPGESGVAGIWTDGCIRGVDGVPLDIADSATVELWHPLNEPAETVQAWRLWLEDQEISQPFKQAHREIYVLTPAEEQTGTYSNRFAAHFLSQARYRTLAQTRLWKVNYLGQWDGGDEGIATRTLEHYDMRAEFWVNSAESEEDDRHGGVTYVSTDQVRFYHPADSAQPVALSEVPAMVFSETMRDVDLFVGVASVGNDQNWVDGGPDGAYRDYWHSYSFGALSAVAKTRGETLERLLPRLKIADRCSIQDRFLVVRGDLRTYKIHLGSGNILMEPNDQYLCIVASRGPAAAGRISLPFEGDYLLSIILSKAFLLAEDRKITDRTILRQIGK